MLDFFTALTWCRFYCRQPQQPGIYIWKSSPCREISDSQLFPHPPALLSFPPTFLTSSLKFECWGGLHWRLICGWALDTLTCSECLNCYPPLCKEASPTKAASNKNFFGYKIFRKQLDSTTISYNSNSKSSCGLWAPQAWTDKEYRKFQAWNSSGSTKPISNQKAAGFPLWWLFLVSNLTTSRIK